MNDKQVKNYRLKCSPVDIFLKLMKICFLLPKIVLDLGQNWANIGLSAFLKKQSSILINQSINQSSYNWHTTS